MTPGCFQPPCRPFGTSPSPHWTAGPTPHPRCRVAAQAPALQATRACLSKRCFSPQCMLLLRSSMECICKLLTGLDSGFRCRTPQPHLAALLHQLRLIRAAAEPLPKLIKLLTNMALGPPQHDSLQKVHERQGPIRAMLLKRLQQQVVPVGARVVRLMSQELQQALQANVTQGEYFFLGMYYVHKPCLPMIGTAACPLH